jgi:hypothetical protein
VAFLNKKGRFAGLNISLYPLTTSFRTVENEFPIWVVTSEPKLAILLVTSDRKLPVFRSLFGLLFDGI